MTLKIAETFPYVLVFLLMVCLLLFGWLVSNPSTSNGQSYHPHLETTMQNKLTHYPSDLQVSRGNGPLQVSRGNGPLQVSRGNGPRTSPQAVSLATVPSQTMSLSNAIPILVRQTARWALASRQDENTVIRLLHANYAAGYLWALKDIASDSEIEKAMGDGFDLKQLVSQVVATQDLATKELTRECGQIKNGNGIEYLAKIAGH